MTLKLGWYRRLAHKLGYDIDKFNQQLTVETHLRDLLPRLKTDLLLDVGANEGQYAQMLRYIGYVGEIISFEPGQVAFSELSKLAAHDPLWSVYNLALSDRAGAAELHLAGASVFNSLHATSDFGAQKYGANIESSSTETITMVRLDEFLPEHVPNHGERRVFLKMDTQGHDLTVFAGAGELRNQFCGVQSEVSVLGIYQAVPNYIDALNIYREFGYEITGIYTVNRHRVTGHVIEFDCILAPIDVLAL